ncbi:MAG: MBL fold metallo-hydrolase [Tannerellaceae bacterium]|jgi:glyoxylase-like metal-dependent hydrolase (beta-lactamase superfamily II)|nr:MBL fold metallo-hydrolase [Tannerellaceae bacterium]
MLTVKIFTVNFFHENTYILYDDTKEAVVIDCGCYTLDEEKEFSKFIETMELKLKYNLCTHLHLDHILGNAFILNTYGLSPHAHRAEVEKIPNPSEQAHSLRISLRPREVKVETDLRGGSVIKFGKTELRCILVPGHSPGSLAFYNEQFHYLFSGDALFSGGIGRTDLWAGSEELLIAAIKGKLLCLPDETIVYPGHGTQTTIFGEKNYNPYL